MIDYSNYKCKFIPLRQIHDIADTFRSQHWKTEKLPLDMELLVEKIGLDIIPVRQVNKIDAYLKSDCKGIVVHYERYMDDRYAKRLRFSLAHEVGHFVLHKEIISKFQFSSIKRYNDFISNFPEDDYNKFEYQANEFSGRLLVPVKRLSEEFEKLVKIIKRSKKLKEMFANDPRQVIFSMSPSLCKPFGVSDEVAEIRIEREGLLEIACKELF